VSSVLVRPALEGATDLHSCVGLLRSASVWCFQAVSTNGASLTLTARQLRGLGAISAPTGLRPELVPGVEILEVFPALGNAAVLELKHQADIDGESLAVSLTRVLLDPGH
jgi:hypothetical protein